MKARSSGPIVWASIITITCLLLFAFQKILFLVVPFLLALIIYYFLYPPMQRLVLAGVSRTAAASLVTLAFTLLLPVCGALMLPWISTNMSDWQGSVERHLHGGIGLLERSLSALEERYAVLQHAHLAATVGARLNDFLGSFAEQYLAPIVLGIAAWLPSCCWRHFWHFSFSRMAATFNAFSGAPCRMPFLKEP